MDTTTQTDQGRCPPAGTREGAGEWAGAAYDGGTEAIAAARDFVVGFLARVRTAEGDPLPRAVVCDAQLVVSELVTNACKFAPGPSAVNLEIKGDVLVVTVWDTESALPIARAAEPGRIGQHGLEIVLAVCEGFDVRREPIGKRIKVRLPIAPRW